MNILKPFNNINDDLLYWIKEYLSYKALEFFENSSTNTVNDIIASIDCIKEARSIDELKKSANLLVRDRLKSMSRVTSASYQLYIYSVGKIKNIEDINTNFLQDFKEWLTIGEATKKGYVDSVLELISYIERTNKSSFVFDVDSNTVRVSKSSISQKMIDPMDEVEFERFGREITKFEYKNEYEKARNIFICRLLLFSGITVSELLSLKLGKSFIVADGKMLIRLDNRKKDIDLPRNLLISHFNKYKELSLKDKNYDITTKPLVNITQQYINIIIKELLEFTNIKREPLSAQLLRYSFFVYIYNKRSHDNEITFNTVFEISGLSNKKELERILNTFDKKSASISKVFEKEKF
jgi:site-specific recombinase XerD